MNNNEILHSYCLIVFKAKTFLLVGGNIPYKFGGVYRIINVMSNPNLSNSII